MSKPREFWLKYDKFDHFIACHKTEKAKANNGAYAIKVREVLPIEEELIDRGILIKKIEQLHKALKRFEQLQYALFPSYPDDVVIKCEVAAGDIREMTKALKGENEKTENK